MIPPDGYHLDTRDVGREKLNSGLLFKRASGKMKQESDRQEIRNYRRASVVRISTGVT